MFANSAIAVENIPKVNSLAWSPLDPAYKTVRFISVGLTQAVLIAIGVGLARYLADRHGGVWPWSIIVGLVALTVVRIVANVANLRFAGYVLRTHDLHYRSGWLVKTQSSVPIERMQHCEVTRGPLDRIFGFASLKVYTAGDSGGDLSVPGLPKDTAERIKDYLLQAMEP